MEVIDNELKRYDTMQADLENLKKSFDNLNADEKDKNLCKSADGLETIMNEEKPKEVKSPIFSSKSRFALYGPHKAIFFHKICPQIADGTTASSNSRAKATSKIRQLVKPILIAPHDIIVA